MLLANRAIMSSFLNLSLIDILGHIILCGKELSCTLQDVQQYVWPLPIKCQQDTFLPSYDNRKCLLTLPNVSWGSKLPPVENDYANVIPSPSLPPKKKKGLIGKELMPMRMSDTANGRAIRAMPLKMWSLDRQHQHYLRPCKKCKPLLRPNVT